MEILGVNLIGILVATLIGMVLGAIWYSPMLFGKQWMKSIGKTPETLTGDRSERRADVALVLRLGVAHEFDE